ncbi:hypothetical protein KUCAC02_027567 [Chaenocephalus aceratus]|uniref:Uncharacterized protein n=1 Tax=Chaenocephalus aceratus TaxID=36190 RepID=A0ACB9W5B0_CHAAC|nr:hypothetical protein KUCAC02_027567 [Chaenocephalus aceratus]
MWELLWIHWCIAVCCYLEPHKTNSHPFIQRGTGTMMHLNFLREEMLDIR